jgi:hypothetical protein
MLVRLIVLKLFLIDWAELEGVAHPLLLCRGQGRRANPAIYAQRLHP